MVPILVVMSGAIAFSAFTGSITTNVNASAGSISFNQQALLYNYSQENTDLSVGTSTANIQLPSGAMSGTFSPISLGWSGPGSSSVSPTQTLTISNMAPGNWATFELTVTNNGSVGLMLQEPNAQNPVVTPSAQESGQALGYQAVIGLPGVDPWPAFFGDMTSTHGYIYFITGLPSGSINNGLSASYFIVVGLGSSSGNHYQGSTFSWTLSIPVTSDP